MDAEGKILHQSMELGSSISVSVGRRLKQVLRACAMPWQLISAVSVVAVLRTPTSMFKYLIGFFLSVIAIWLLIAAYLLTAKPSYTSHWTLILPTSSSGVSLQLESIGHAQTVSSSPFGSATLSPKVIYKEIISSEKVLLAAAKSLGLSLKEFGGVRVKLIDETSLILLEITGSSPHLAQQKAMALMDAFHLQLDFLRNDEIQRRADVVNLSLKAYRITLDGARDKISAHQQATGVLSINQYNEASTSLELMKRKLADIRADESRLAAEQKSLSAQLQMSPKAAAAMLKLAADPAFIKVTGDYADSISQYSFNATFMDDANPLLRFSRERAEHAKSKLQERTNAAGIEFNSAALDVSIVMNATHKSDLVKILVANDAAIDGKREEMRTLTADLDRAAISMKTMNTAAARLEDYKKDHLLAEAVFTSALARLDTNKVDIYASYPMVQTLAPPDQPMKQSSPSTVICLVLGAIGSLLALAAWSMMWLRHVFLQQR
jgi:uncharacterized protein involved in exopolysaccharide biosynthesis